VEREETSRGAVERREGGAGPLFGGFLEGVFGVTVYFYGEVNPLDAVAYAEELFSYPPWACRRMPSRRTSCRLSY
jgi:hypothetical protein